jgi:hypothetical protein
VLKGIADIKEQMKEIYEEGIMIENEFDRR